MRLLKPAFFTPEVELVLRAAGVTLLIGLIVLPISWAYEQRRQARAWQSVACAYRMREVTRRVPLVTMADARQDPCVTLQRLGLDLDVRRY
jgi:hypothetical protein